MAGHRSFLRVGLVLAAAAALVLQALPTQAAIAHESFHQTNLVSDIQGLATVTDTKLVNPWALSSSPTSQIWVSDNNAAASTLYNSAGQKVPLTVNIPAPGDGSDGPFLGTPTGTVCNLTEDFPITVKTTTGKKTGKSFFLFATEDGTLLGWNPTVDLTHAVIAVDNSREHHVGAVYKGLTNGSFNSKNYLYAANFRFGTVDVFDRRFHGVTLGDAFTDTSLPAGFAPFGIQNIGGFIYVTYALQNAEKHDDVKGPGNGFVDIYTMSGALVRRFA